MKVSIIENIEDIPQFEAQNVFQTREWMQLFEGEIDTKVLFFAIFNNDRQLIMLQPVTIQRYMKWLPWRLGAYAVAWREPWSSDGLADDATYMAFRALSSAIEQYCSMKTLYLEYRHQSQCLQSTIFRTYKKLPWYNIYHRIEAGEEVAFRLHKSKRRQLNQSIKAGIEVVLEPTDEQIREWYLCLQTLYKRIHRPLPSVDVFLRLKSSGIGQVFVLLYQGRVVSGSAILYKLGDITQYFYDWYRASLSEEIPNIYPSVVSTWQAMQLVADMGGGEFDFMGAGPQNREYGVREFKLKFGGEIKEEYRYRKITYKII